MVAKSFTVPVEPVQSSDVVVTDRPFIPPARQTAPGSTSQQHQSTGQKKGKKATQPVEAPGALPGSQQMESSGDVSANQPVETPGADTDSLPTDPDAPLPASAHRTGSRPDLQFPVPASKHSFAITGPTVPVGEPTLETGHSSDHSSSAADEGEVSDLDSTSQDQEELLEGDQEERISGPLYQQNSPHSYRQHYSGCLHKQGRGNEVGSSVCFTMENSDLVYQETGYS